MTPKKIAAHDVVSSGDLKALAAASGPCITIVEPIPNPIEMPARLKNAVRGVEKQLTGYGIAAGAIASLIQPVQDLAETAEAAGIWANSLILFRSPDVFHYYLLPGKLTEVLTVEERFQVRPLLSALVREQRFHLLGLSQRHIRLFHCTQHGAEEVAIQGLVPQDLRAWMNTRQPDHVLDNRSTGGSSVGSMKGVIFGTSTDRDRENQYLSHFFKEVDRGVNNLLRNNNHAEPLVLAGVDYELAIYRRVNSYPRLLDKAVQGSPDGLSGPVLHERAREIAMRSFSEPLQKALSDFQKHRNDKRLSTVPREIVKAAFEGRLADLFFSESAGLRGAWNGRTTEVETGGQGEDLLNAAALQTVLHGGRAFVLSGPDMPLPADVAGVLRF
jgi:hypothetical protein